MPSQNDLSTCRSIFRIASSVVLLGLGCYLIPLAILPWLYLASGQTDHHGLLFVVAFWWTIVFSSLCIWACPLLLFFSIIYVFIRATDRPVGPQPEYDLEFETRQPNE